MSRISQLFSMRSEKVIPFLTAGYPDKSYMVKMVLAAEESGASMVEIGMPFSDPLADGPVIQRASQVAIENGVNIKWILETVEEIRASSEIPLVLMGYINPIIKYGLVKFMEDCQIAGVDGLIIPDLPLEEAGEIVRLCKLHEISPILLVAPNTLPDRIKIISDLAEDLIYCVDKFKNTSLLVIGDTILDQYVACDALGMSAEAPVVVVRELDTREYVGGAAVVAMHVRALGAKCHYLSVVGQDSNADIIDKELESYGISHRLVKDESRPTTFKIRYLVNNQKMFRVSRMIEHSIPRTVEEKIIREIRTGVSNVRGILISDFVYGVITPRILKTITEIAKKHNLLVFGDLQCSSQVGNVSKFKNFDLLCPTEKESRIALEAQEEGLEWVAINLMKKSNASNLVMKLGGDGFISYESGEKDFINRQ